MKGAIVFVVAAALFAAVSAGSIPFTNCGSSSDIVTINSIDIDGKLAPGNTINITANAKAASEIKGGSFKLEVKFLGITVLTKTGNVCDSSYLKFHCPVAAGTFSADGSLSLPGSVPAGSYTVQISAENSAGDALFCVSIALTIGSEATGADLKRPALSQDIIDAVNGANAGWTAAHNSRFAGRTLGYAKGLMGTFTDPEKLVQLPPSTLEPLPESQVPSAFDARTQWPKCADMIGHIRDQADCGSCWAFGSTEAFNDRKCIATSGSFQTELSAQDTTSCCTLFTGCGFSQGCGGGDPGAAWNYFVNTGVVSGGDYDTIGKGTTCFPYQLPNCSHHEKGKYANCSSSIAPTPACPNPLACSEKSFGTPWANDLTHAKSAYSIFSVSQMQTELMTYGSITVAFTVYEDFLHYRSGVYKHTTGQELGGHAVKILGWGEENGQPYWTVANSWNQYWGDEGFFKIARGVNECGIESQVSAGHA